MRLTSPFCQNAATQNGTHWCMGPACLYACLTTSGPAPNEMSNGFQSPPRSVRRSELLDSLAFNLAVLDLGQVSMSASLKQWVQGFHSIS